MIKGGSWIGTVAFLVVCVGVLALVRTRLGGTAPTPHAFASHATLTDALAASAETGKPVLAFATADWCGPCQTLKRGALSDERVASWITEHTVPAYIDLTTQDDPESQDAARLLSISSVPALVLIERGEEKSRRTGVQSADGLLAWLRESAPATGG